MGEAWPSPQHKIIKLNLSLPASTRFLVYLTYINISINIKKNASEMCVIRLNMVHTEEIPNRNVNELFRFGIDLHRSYICNKNRLSLTYSNLTYDGGKWKYSHTYLTVVSLFGNFCFPEITTGEWAAITPTDNRLVILINSIIDVFQDGNVQFGQLDKTHESVVNNFVVQ